MKVIEHEYKNLKLAFYCFQLNLVLKLFLRFKKDSTLRWNIAGLKILSLSLSSSSLSHSNSLSHTH